ncbi:sulfite oxidase [Arthrobacter crystallopoietes]|uniref:sulfite oxidase n=1 Tax=Crystallibacter crystallopoietes TaxID=37928 RepID=UPI003D1ACB37
MKKTAVRSGQARSAQEKAPSPHPAEPSTGLITEDELLLASRNHAMPLEMLRWYATPAGMHYLVIHWDVPAVDPETWSLRLHGAVHRELQLGLDDLRARDRRTLDVTLECAGNGRSLLKPRPVSQPWVLGGVSNAVWTGTPLSGLLAESGLEPGAVELVFTGEDRGFQGGVEQPYARSLPVEVAASDDVLLAYEMNGQPLMPQHGFPLRLLVPGWYGMTSVKWLRSIEAVTTPFEGFQQSVAYRFQQDAEDPGTRVSRIRVRALMVPPGEADFATRRRVLAAGPAVLEGRAWSGHGAVTAVSVGIDGMWFRAHLEPAVDRYAWRRWTFPWVASEGTHELMCRAEDTAGNIQPLEPEWNYQGMGNNAVQRIEVTVRPSLADGTAFP